MTEQRRHAFERDARQGEAQPMTTLTLPTPDAAIEWIEIPVFWRSSADAIEWDEWEFLCLLGEMPPATLFPKLSHDTFIQVRIDYPDGPVTSPIFTWILTAGWLGRHT